MKAAILVAVFVTATLAGAGAAQGRNAGHQAYGYGEFQTESGDYLYVNISVSMEINAVSPSGIQPTVNASVYNYSTGESCADTVTVAPGEYVTDFHSFSSLTTELPSCGAVALTWTGASVTRPGLHADQSATGCNPAGVGYCASASLVASSNTDAVVTGFFADYDLTTTPLSGTIHTDATESVAVHV